MNPVALFFSFLAINIIKILGRRDPAKAITKDKKGENEDVPQISLFIANGIAILLSNVGIIATKIMANHTQFSKLFDKKSVNEIIV